MKKMFYLFLAFLLMAVLCTGCKKKKADAHAASIADDPSIVDINSENPLENLPAPTLPPENIQNLIRINSVIEPGESGLKVQGTPVTFIPSSTENESQYTLQEGSIGEYVIPFDATIEFPLTEDPAHSVAIMGEEFDGEFRSFVETNHFYPLFTYTGSGSTITGMEYFYLP